MDVTKLNIQLTEEARIAIVQKVHTASQKGNTIFGLRIGIRSTGCKGHSYYMELAQSIHSGETVIDLSNDVKLFIHAHACMFLLNTTIDFIKSDVKTGFVFHNPNISRICHCGTSYHFKNLHV